MPGLAEFKPRLQLLELFSKLQKRSTQIYKLGGKMYGVELFTGEPDRPYSVLGQVAAKQDDGNIEDVNSVLIEQATRLGADGIINLSYDRKVSMMSWKQLTATGTAVKFESDDYACPVCAERMHTGFTHTDYHKWTIDIYTETGAIYEYSHLLGTDNQDLNSQREYVTSVLNAVGDYYPVTASGNHSVSESGYRTTMSYWF